MKIEIKYVPREAIKSIVVNVNQDIAEMILVNFCAAENLIKSKVNIDELKKEKFKALDTILEVILKHQLKQEVLMYDYIIDTDDIPPELQHLNPENIK